MRTVDRNEVLAAAEAEVSGAGGVLVSGFPAWLRPLLVPGTMAITLGRRVYVGPDLLASTEREIAAIVAHEIEHVRQFARVGAARFAWIYLRDYARNRRKGMTAFAAYEAIPFEVEARSAERRFRLAEEAKGEPGRA